MDQVNPCKHDDLKEYFARQHPQDFIAACAAHALTRAGISSMQQLASLSDAQIEKTRNIGEKTIKLVRQVLEAYRKETEILQEVTIE